MMSFLSADSPVCCRTSRRPIATHPTSHRPIRPPVTPTGTRRRSDRPDCSETASGRHPWQCPWRSHDPKKKKSLCPIQRPLTHPAPQIPKMKTMKTMAMKKRACRCCVRARETLKRVWARETWKLMTWLLSWKREGHHLLGCACDLHDVGRQSVQGVVLLSSIPSWPSRTKR